MIREAILADLPAICRIIFDASDQMGFHNDFMERPDENSVVDVTFNALCAPSVNMSVVDIYGEILGVCIVELLPLMWNRNKIVAREHVWHMDPHMKNKQQAARWFVKMLDHMIAWAKSNGASLFWSSAKPGLPACKLLQRRGIKLFESSYLGGL